KEGWCFNRDIHLTADGEEHTIILERGLEVNGTVTDAVTGEPIADFKAIPAYGNGADEQLWRGDTRRGINGSFKLAFNETRGVWRVLIEADGYLSETSRPLTANSTNTLKLALKRTNPALAMRGVVLQPDGSPAADVQVVLLTTENNVTLMDNQLF